MRLLLTQQQTGDKVKEMIRSLGEKAEIAPLVEPEPGISRGSAGGRIVEGARWQAGRLPHKVKRTWSGCGAAVPAARHRHRTRSFLAEHSETSCRWDVVMENSKSEIRNSKSETFTPESRRASW